MEPQAYVFVVSCPNATDVKLWPMKDHEPETRVDQPLPRRPASGWDPVRRTPALRARQSPTGNRTSVASIKNNLVWNQDPEGTSSSRSYQRRPEPSQHSGSKDRIQPESCLIEITERMWERVAAPTGKGGRTLGDCFMRRVKLR
jgi:hypothetical protein